MKLLQSTSVYGRLFAIVLVMIMLLMVFAGVLLIQSEENIQTSARNALLEKTNSVLNVLKLELSQIDRSLTQLLYDVDLQKLAYIYDQYSDYDRTKLVSQIKDKLKYAHNCSNIVFDVCLMVPNCQQVIHTSASYNYQDFDLDFFNNFANIKSGTFVADFNNKSYFVYAPSTANRRYILLVEIQKTYLMYFLETNLNLSDISFGLYHNGTCVISNLPNDLVKQDEGYAIGDVTSVSIGRTNYQLYTQIFIDDNSILYCAMEETWLASHRYLYMAFFTLIAGILAFSVFSIVYIRNNVKVPIVRLINTFEKNNWDDSSTRNELEMISSNVNQMNSELERAVYMLYEQHMLLQEAELRQLQMQINPHFLYNSFFMLNQTIRAGEIENAMKLSKMLGIFFKYITKDTGPMASLADEVEYARVYANVQIMRFGGRINLDFLELPDSIASYSVPKLCLQPLLENAFRHALESKSIDGFLRVYFSIDSQWIHIVVEDNGEHLTEENLAEMNADLNNYSSGEPAKSALINIHRRLQITFGPQSGLRLLRSELGGLRAELVLKRER